MRRIAGLSTLCTLGALLIAASPAGAAERVADGNFESTACNGSDCVSPAWSEFASNPNVAIGPLCADPAQASGPPSCADGGLSGYTSPYHWARMGSSTVYVGGDDRPPTLTTAITQNVLIPAAPATLAFNAHIVPAPYARGELRVTVAGQLVFSTNDLSSGYGTYPRVSVPVGFAAGPGPKELRFEADAEVDPGAAPEGDPVFSDTFDVDDVSLDAPDAPAAPAVLPAPAIAAGPTGQRAAALKKCAKIKKKSKKKKCKKRARTLPV